MFDLVLEITELTGRQLLILSVVAFLAGLVRGFAGFALSAVMMAGAAFVLPPVALIPVCYILEGAASLLMVRGGLNNVNWSVVALLVCGALIGLPLGLSVTGLLPADQSRIAAYLLLIVAATLQLFRISHPFLATRSGTVVAGICAGFATGIASLGGMIIALFVIARGDQVKEIRGSLIMYLFVGMFTSIWYLLAFDVMNGIAFWRGVALTPILVVGVGLGMLLFRPSLEPFYKRFCLILLIGLSAFGLLRML